MDSNNKHKTLQILVPRYKEIIETIKPLFDSIAIQHSVDLSEIEVLVGNDGTPTLPHSFFKSYNYDIRVLNFPHRGVSSTRNALLDAATADYIMYCDADDMFFSVHAIWVILTTIKEKNFDAMHSIFMEEAPCASPATPICYITRENDQTFVHGKVYRRQYLVDNNIRWIDGAVYHEDSYFNFLACNIPGINLVYCQTPFYLWVKNPNSTVRTEVNFGLKTYPEMIKNNDKMVEAFLERKINDKAVFAVVNMVYGAYYNLNRKEWKAEENKEYIDAVEKELGRYIIKYAQLWNISTQEVKDLVWRSVMANMTKIHGNVEFTIEFDPWLTRIANEEIKRSNLEVIG